MPLLAKVVSSIAKCTRATSEPSGDFPNVPGHVSNPENTAVFDEFIAYARQSGGDISFWPPIPIAIAWDAPRR